MNDINKVGVSRVQTYANGIAFEKRSSRVKSCDPADILYFHSGKAGHVCAQWKAYEMVILRDDSFVVINHSNQKSDLFANELGIGRRLNVVGQGGTVLPVHHYYIDIILKKISTG